MKMIFAGEVGVSEKKGGFLPQNAIAETRATPTILRERWRESAFIWGFKFAPTPYKGERSESIRLGGTEGVQITSVKPKKFLRNPRVPL